MIKKNKQNTRLSVKSDFPIGGLILTLIITGLILFHFNKQVLLSPNDFLLANSGDAIKSYFASLSLLKDNSSLNQLQTMNYPYGQTHIYTDGQIGIMWIIRSLKHISPWFGYHAMGIINYFYFISWILCAMFLYLIFLKLRLPILFRVAGALSVTLLSPQIFRVLGHPTLCYVCVFPIAWFLLIKFRETKYKPFYFFVIILNCIFWYFVHPYYLPAITFFYFLFWLIGFMQGRIDRKELLFWGMSICILPNLFSLAYLHFFDFHLNRSLYPYGFWDYHASINTVFAPVCGPFLELFRYLFKIEYQEWEGWSYIGVSSIIIFLFYIFKSLRYLFRLNFRAILKPVYPSQLSIAFWPAIILLAYSMCFPFRFGFEFLYNIVGPLRQFRSLGRFAWIFYYVFGVFAVYTLFLLCRYLNMKRMKLLSAILFLLYFGISLSEGLADHSTISNWSTSNPNYFSLNLLDPERADIVSKIRSIKNNYQALISFPFYNKGSENFDKSSKDNAIASSMIVSYWSDLPLVNSSAARSPITEAKNIMQMLGPAEINKDILKDLPNKKNFLVLFIIDSLNYQEEEFLSRCHLIAEYPDYKLLEISYNDLFLKKRNYASMMEGKSLIKVNNLMVEGDTSDLLFNDFEKNNSDIIYEGKGTLQTVKKDNNHYLLQDHPLNAAKETEFVLSFWIYNKDELRLQNNCFVDEMDSSKQNRNRLQTVFTAESLTIDGNWSLIEIKFKTTRDNPLISVFIDCDKKSEQKVFTDNFLLRRKGTHVYRVEELNDNVKKISFDNLPLQ